MAGACVVARMFDDAFAHTEGEVEASPGGVSLLEPCDDTEGVQVVVKSEAVPPQGGIKGFLACVSEGWVANVVSEGKRLGEILVQSECRGDGAGDLGDFEGMSEAAAKVVPWQIACEAGKYLGFTSEASKGPGVEDTSAVTREGRSIGMSGFRMLTTGEFPGIVYSDFRG